jgi:acyl-CoA synthetase (AMP-forming)/AMP-acid ligase II
MSAANWEVPAPRTGLHEQDGLLAETVGGVLRRQARARGSRRAVLWEAGGEAGGERGGELRWLTYAQLAARANAVAHRLSHLAQGERVAVWGRNCAEWVLLEYACALRGLVLVPLNTTWTDAEAAAAIELAGPAVLFAGADNRGGPLEERARALAGNTNTDVRSLGGLLSWTNAPHSWVSLGPDAPFLLQFTSGTTGAPKGALLSHRSVLNSSYLRERRDASGGVRLSSVPYHHIGGSLYVVGALTTGGAFVVVDRFDPEQTVRLLSLAQVTDLGGVPVMIERVLSQPGFREAARTVKTVALGGAGISPQLIRRVTEDLGAVVHTTYGQSECPIITNSDPADGPEVLATTAGRPVAATEVRIVDPATGHPVNAGETGEIVVRSPMVMRGYFRDTERTRDVLSAEGLLRTGDLGSVDADGYLTIHGRTREVVPDPRSSQAPKTAAPSDRNPR